jgi:hypothetical protein
MHFSLILATYSSVGNEVIWHSSKGICREKDDFLPLDLNEQFILDATVSLYATFKESSLMKSFEEPTTKIIVYFNVKHLMSSLSINL